MILLIELTRVSKASDADFPVGVDELYHHERARSALAKRGHRVDGECQIFSMRKQRTFSLWSVKTRMQ